MNNISPSREEFELIAKIAQRAVNLAKKQGVEIDSLLTFVDICLVHEKTPLNLQALLDANDGNFGHDVFGIRRHINRETGELGDFFVPRYATNQ